jgi:phage baseplate assembly protein gpV
VSRVYSVVTGLVTDVNDPDSQGRVNVKLPWLGGESESFWAPVATLMSGGDRGSWFMPEVDDEVLIAFEHGDPAFPFVIGFLWNGVDRPPSEGGHSVRRIRTVSGHVLEFHDEDGGHRILLRTAGGQRVDLDDVARTITIETSGHERVRLSPGRVRASTSGGQSVELDDGPPSATVRAGVGIVTLDTNGINVTSGFGVATAAGTTASVIAGTNVAITSGGEVTITAPIVNVVAPVATFAGIVVAETLVAGSVVSPSYTPGAGNLV